MHKRRTSDEIPKNYCAENLPSREATLASGKIIQIFVGTRGLAFSRCRRRGFGLPDCTLKKFGSVPPVKTAWCTGTPQCTAVHGPRFVSSSNHTAPEEIRSSTMEIEKFRLERTRMKRGRRTIYRLDDALRRIVPQLISFLVLP